MRDYEKGQRQGIKESLNDQLKSTLTRIEIEEEAIEKLKREKWSIIRKIELLEMQDFDIEMVLDDNEKLTLFDKIEWIKKGWSG
jgi:spermidine synthase